MKVKVLIEYDFPGMESLTMLDIAAIEDGLVESVPSFFTPADDEPFSAEYWTIRVLE